MRFLPTTGKLEQQWDSCQQLGNLNNSETGASDKDDKQCEVTSSCGWGPSPDQTLRAARWTFCRLLEHRTRVKPNGCVLPGYLLWDIHQTWNILTILSKQVFSELQRAHDKHHWSVLWTVFFLLHFAIKEVCLFLTSLNNFGLMIWCTQQVNLLPCCLNVAAGWYAGSCASVKIGHFSG